MIYLLLIYEFFKIGLFSFGGGYATIPFLYRISQSYGWFSADELSKITAVASVTPGPVGINAATYAGIKTAGILGALCATIAEVLPSLLIILLISNILEKFRENKLVKNIISTLKPLSCGLLVAVIYELIKNSVQDLRGILILGILTFISFRIKKSVAFYICFSAILGILSKSL